ncbi:hypothetical protein [Gordonia aichiensis]
MSCPAPRLDTARPVKAAAIDVHHASRRSAVVLGPLALPDASTATVRLRRFAELGPQTRIGLQPSPDRRTWLFAPDGLATAVHTAPPTDDPRTLLDVLTSRAPGPLRVVLSGDHVAIAYDHGLGDTTLVNTIVDVLLGVDDVDVTLLPRLRTSTSALAIAGASVLCDPRRVVALARMHLSRDFRPPHPCQMVAIDRPGSTTSVMVRFDTKVVESMRAERAVRAPDVGMFAIYTVALVRALTAAGLRVNPMVTLPFDARAYLPRSVGTMANFAAGLDFAVLPDTSPTALQAELSAASTMGRPVANLVVTAIKSRLAQRRGTSENDALRSWTPAGEAAIDLLHSSGGVVPGRRGRWTFTDPDTAYVIGVADPPSPTGITVTSTSVTGSLCLTATFRDDVFAPDAVAAALDDVPSQASAALDETVPRSG